MTLIEKETDINAKNANGDSLLTFACKNRLEFLAMALIEKGADVDILDKNGEGALLIALEEKLESVALALIEKGADIDVFDKRCRSPLLIALKEKLESVALALIEKGADIDVFDIRSRNPLLIALEKKLESVALVLIEKGADKGISRNGEKSWETLDPFQLVHVHREEAFMNGTPSKNAPFWREDFYLPILQEVSKPEKEGPLRKEAEEYLNREGIKIKPLKELEELVDLARPIEYLNSEVLTFGSDRSAREFKPKAIIHLAQQLGALKFK